MEYQVQNVNVLILSILVLYLGVFLTKKIPFLEKNNSPSAVTGGLICSILVAVIFIVADLKISFEMRLRDIFLLTFFSTIGLGAKFRMLAAGGKALLILLICSIVFLVIQNLTGVGLAVLLDAHPAYGLFGGSVSFAGGHGTAIAWGKEAEAAGLAQAKDLGIAFATFGLIAGGAIGGPIAGRLIKRFKLRAHSESNDESASKKESLTPTGIQTSSELIGTLLALGICVALGDGINRFLFKGDIMLPGFLTAMLVGIFITNTADLLKVKTSKAAIDTIGDVSLQLFLSMSLMSMDLTTLFRAAGPILFVLFIQMTIITFFAVFAVFRVMGRNYDAAVISGGFVGLGLGATPVAIGQHECRYQ